MSLNLNQDLPQLHHHTRLKSVVVNDDNKNDNFTTSIMRHRKNKRVA